MRSNSLGASVVGLVASAGGVVGVALHLGAGASPAFAEDAGAMPVDLPPPLRSVEVPWTFDSGAVANPGAVETREVVASTIVHVPGAAWLKVHLGGTTLAGDPAAEGAVVRLTSLLDGGTQPLNNEQIERWAYSSAYLNGDAVLVEVLAHGGTGDSRLVISGVTAGDGVGSTQRSLCGAVDQRVAHEDARVARLLPVGCTAWLFNDVNRTFLTAGHCTVASTSVIQFNVPLSTMTGGLVNPPPEHQYAPDMVSNQGSSPSSLGNDWRYFGCFPNPGTGLTPYQAQGEHYILASAAPAVAGQSITISGYGTNAAPADRRLNQALTTHTGPYWSTQFSAANNIIRYRPDTTGGNSGSAVFMVETGLAIGIHTHAGCSAGNPNSANQGCAIQHAPIQTALAAPRGVSRSGVGVPTGDLYVYGDAMNNFGRVNTTTGNFARVSTVGTFPQGLAYDAAQDRFYTIDTLGNLRSVHPVTGAPTALGRVTGTSLTFTGLAFDPFSRTLYGVTQSSGQVWSINLTTRVATPVGSPLTGTLIGALEFDTVRRVLWALDDTAPATRLLRIDPVTMTSTVVGVLRTGTTDCNGLAYDPATDSLFTIDATSDALLRINPQTGAATVAGPTNGSFGAASGMAFRAGIPCNDLDFNNDSVTPDDQDLRDFLSVFAGSACTGCDSIDFNNDGVFPDEADLMAYLRVLGGGGC